MVKVGVRPDDGFDVGGLESVRRQDLRDVVSYLDITFPGLYALNAAGRELGPVLAHAQVEEDTACPIGLRIGVSDEEHVGDAIECREARELGLEEDIDWDLFETSRRVHDRDAHSRFGGWDNRERVCRHLD